MISQTRPSADSGTITSYYHYDGLGSTRALSSESGAVTDHYNYDAFGNLLDKSGRTINHYRYTGEQFDANSGFYYLRARYMNPQVGRFVTMDEFAGLNRDPYSLHKYLYANANPVNMIDPSGHFSLPGMLAGLKERGSWEVTTSNSTQVAIRVGINIGLKLGLRLGLNSALAHYQVGKMREAVGKIARQAIDDWIQEQYDGDMDDFDDDFQLLYRGMSGRDCDDLDDYNTILSKALRAPAVLLDRLKPHIDPGYEGPYSTDMLLWGDSVIQNLLKNAMNLFVNTTFSSNFGLEALTTKHMVSSELSASHLISLTESPERAADWAVDGDDPGYHIAKIRTVRAKKVPRFGDMGMEHVIPFIIKGYPKGGQLGIAGEVEKKIHVDEL